VVNAREELADVGEVRSGVVGDARDQNVTHVARTPPGLCALLGSLSMQDRGC
jgi:hypothetical protein